MDYSSLSKSRRAEWINSLSSKGEDMLYTISAHGEIEPEDVDVLHTSAAAHMASIKRRKKKARSGGSKSKNNSLKLSPEEVKVKTDLGNRVNVGKVCGYLPWVRHNADLLFPSGAR